MTRRWRLLCWLLAGSVVAAAAPAQALGPQEVVVVVNANAKGSEALGKYYCLSRNILEDRMIVLRTTAGPVVDRADYYRQIRDPIRSFLLKNDLKAKTKCLALMWGVPVRVLGTKMTTEQQDLVSAYKVPQKRLHVRAAVNLSLLATVGKKFPRPRTQTLRPIGYLFEEGTVPELEKGRRFRSIAQLLGARLRQQQQAAKSIEDSARREIALRQCAALRLDSFGPKDLLKNLPAGKIAGLPDKSHLLPESQSLQAQRDKLLAEPETPEVARRRVQVITKLGGVVGAYEYCQDRLELIDTVWEDASVDSELALLWEEPEAPLRGPRPNPMNWRLANAKTRPAKLPQGIIMTARADGPTVRDALRIIKDSAAAEKDGIKGKFYVDAGGKYRQYDVHLTKLAEIIEKHTKIPLVLNTEKQLFRPGSCPDAALYVGWYGVQKYVPAFTWVRGSVGWHIASLEAVHLRAAGSPEWCVKMIQNGVAATLGAVNEPYLHAFPLPQDFFALLLTGRFTLAECYWKSLPSVSWRMTLIGDPLYNPFRLHPQLSIYSLPPALVGRPTGGSEKQ